MKIIPSDSAIKLEKLVNELELILNEDFYLLAFGSYFQESKDKVLLSNIRLDLKECSYSFFMLYQRLIRFRDLSRVDFTVTGIREINNKMVYTHQVTTESSILIKSIYNYFYAIQEMIESSNKFKNELPESIQHELKRVCEFRSKLIVHKQNQKLFTGGSQKYSPEQLYFTLQVGQYVHVTSEMLGLCKRLYNLSKDEFPEDDQNESNFFEMKNLLYKNLQFVPKKFQKEVKGFLSAYGASSDHPLILGELLKNLLNNFLNISKSY
ncbi:MAG: hypothetical protein GY909_17850 [Oligoflexia bacterium]|nr:hypothetical protein [Oligoflexia bacterium]